MSEHYYQALHLPVALLLRELRDDSGPLHPPTIAIN